MNKNNSNIRGAGRRVCAPMHTRTHKTLFRRILMMLFMLSVLIIIAGPIFQISPIFKRQYSLANFQRTISLDRVNDLLGERIVYQSINMKNSEGNWLRSANFGADDRIDVLLYISTDRFYLFQDGAEDDWAIRMRYKNFSDAYTNWRNQGTLIKNLIKHYKMRSKLLKQLPPTHPLVLDRIQYMRVEMYNYDPIYRDTLIERNFMKNQAIAHLQNRGYKDEVYKAKETRIEILEKNLRERLSGYEDLLRREFADILDDEDERIGSDDSSRLGSGQNSGGTRTAAAPQDFQGQQILFPPVPNLLKLEGLAKNGIDNKIDSLTIVSRNPRRVQTDIKKIPGTIERLEISPDVETLYTSLRDQHVQKYAQLFRSAVKNSTRQAIWTESYSIEYSPEQCGPAPISTEQRTVGYAVRLLANDHTEFFAEDCNGDGITETLLAWSPDYFNWGDRDMPNALIIYNNVDQKISGFIGDLVNAYRTLGYDPATENPRIKKLIDQENLKSKRTLYLLQGDFRDLDAAR